MTSSTAQTIKKDIICPETRRQWINIAYILIACAMFLHHVYVTIYYDVIRDGSYFLTVPWLILAVISFILGRQWKDKGFWLLAIWLTWKIVWHLINGSFPGQYHGIIFNAYAFFICYAAGSVLNEKNRENLLRLFCPLWTIAMVVFSMYGLYVVWYGTSIPNLGNQWVVILIYRLKIIYHFVETGILEGVSIGVAFVGFFLCRNKIAKWLYIPAILIMLITSAFTTTRAAYIIISLELAVILCIKIGNRLRKRNEDNKLKVTEHILLVITFIVSTVLVAWLQTYIVDGMNLLRHQGLLVGSAKAEGLAGVTENTMHRGFVLGNLDNMLSGRVSIWKEAFQVILDNPKILLLGMPTEQFMVLINEARIAAGLQYVYGTHSVFVQMLMEYGLIPFLIYCWFQIRFVRRAYLLLKNQTLPMWQRIIPLPALGCLMCEFIDTTTYGWLPQTTIMYLFIGLTIAVSAPLVKQGVKRSCR